MQSHLTIAKKPKWKLSFWLSPPSQLLLLVSLHVYLVSVTNSGGSGWWTRSAATCGTSQSPYGSQPWSRRVAVFCSHRNQTWNGELGSYSEGHDFMFMPTSPSSSASSFWFSLTAWSMRTLLFRALKLTCVE